MKKEDCRKYCLEIYQDLYRQVTLYSDFIVSTTKNDETTLNKFVDSLYKIYGEQQIGINFLANIIESCFTYWVNQKTKFGTGIIMFNWIFGKKSLDRYESIKHLDSKMNPYKSRSIKKIVRATVLKKYNPSSKLLTNSAKFTSVVEEEEKARYLNEDIGFVWCSQNTTLYNHMSQYCMQCNYKKDCKETLKINYSKIYKLRGYE